ncbi:J domain-containing protein [Adhaeretor mobilis]|uniref:J domain-containing protein n=1 Tax=Adhaeretor mobilis TaxID=1930276 RepID=A0A517MUG5_9BACT|nr:hypothetical protein [Adhaeretor mobilis]QDS98521.1 hypothetical protein HG15A2_18020 [Adhaeretor mobilis]
MLSLLIASREVRPWPDGIDSTVTLAFLAIAFGVPAIGYFFLVLDFRRYLRSLRRALVIANNITLKIPYWALRDRPSCLTALGLAKDCSEADVLEAYREKVKTQHPDRGGNLKNFLQLQQNFELALQVARQTNSDDAPQE